MCYNKGTKERDQKKGSKKTMKKIKVFLKNAKLLNIILAVIVDMAFYAKPEVFELVHIEAKKFKKNAQGA